MIWIAPSENDPDNTALEKRLWDATEQPVPATHFAETVFNRAPPEELLSFIFLCFVEVSFACQRASMKTRVRRAGSNPSP
jgi:hypothetical protein